MKSREQTKRGKGKERSHPAHKVEAPDALLRGVPGSMHRRRSFPRTGGSLQDRSPLHRFAVFCGGGNGRRHRGIESHMSDLTVRPTTSEPCGRIAHATQIRHFSPAWRGGGLGGRRLMAGLRVGRSMMRGVRAAGARRSRFLDGGCGFSW